MATVTFIKYQKQSASALRGVAQYVSQDEKTLDENGSQLISGQNCTPHWSARSSRPRGICTTRRVPCGFTTTSSPFLRMR